MKYTITSQAMTYSPEMKEIPSSPKLDGIKACEESMENYLDPDLYDLGIIGGEIWIRVRDGACSLETVFWSPEPLSSESLERLVKDVEGHLSDGIGESGFEHIVEARKVIVQSVLPQESTVEIADDGRAVPEPPLLGTAAWNRNTEEVRKMIQSTSINLERRYQFCTPLQLAIISGAEEIINLLLSAGADAKSLTDGWDPNTSLELCAKSNDLSDEQSVRVATALVEHGADPHHVTASGETAQSYAINRRKSQLASYLGNLSHEK